MTDFEFVWLWPGWPAAMLIFVFFLSSIALLRFLRPLHVVWFTLVFSVIATTVWLLVWPNVSSIAVYEGWPKLIVTLLAITLAPLIVVAVPMLALHRVRARPLITAGVGLLATTVAVFSFFAVGHHIGCTIARIDCI